MNIQSNNQKTHINQEAPFARRLLAQLDEAPLTPVQTERLRKIRIAALEKARAPVAVRHGVLAGAVQWFQQLGHDRHRSLIAAAGAVAIFLAVGIYWQSLPEPWDADEDIQLLAGDLPPDAYLSDRVDSIASDSTAR